jgi:hypothetical protein
MEFWLADPSLDAGVTLLSDNEMDAVVGGQAVSAGVDFALSAAGPNLAMVAAVLNVSTSDTDGSKMASATGTLVSLSD